ncbi:MAG: MBL fold metallo-hydrolase [Saprospiraceae bacterium]
MVIRIKNIAFPSNTYLLINSNKQCIIIDPGTDYMSIDSEITRLMLLPTYILATHGHFDHVSTVSFFQEKYEALFGIHFLDKTLLKSINFYRKVMKIEGYTAIPVPDFIFSKNTELLDLTGFEIRSYNFPGHTKGSCVFKWNDKLFTGDTLYVKGLGFNGFPGENKPILKKSLIHILDLFVKNYHVYPGHGKDDKLNNIRTRNTELFQFIEMPIDG